MAHLLGGQNCLESLAVDICDVQEAIDGIFSRVPPVRFPSWKYPDKASCDLDMDELLSRYCYSKDDDHCKLSHIILFELLIDRMVLLLQALSSFCNSLLSNTSSNRPGTAKSVGSAMSVGLVVKKYWNKMAHLYQIIQKELAESANKTAKVRGLEETIADMKQEITTLQEAVKNKPSKHSHVKGEIKSKSNSKTSAKFILSNTMDMNLESPSSSKDITLSVEEVALTRTCKEVTTQTYDTAFVPCEACSRTQDNLIEVGKMVMKVCESQGLPSSLAKQKRLLKQSLLAAADVSRWAAEQNRDLSRINNHLDNLYAQIQPLQESLSKSKEKRKVLEEQVKQLEESIVVEKQEAKKIAEDLSGRLNKVVEEKSQIELKSSNEIEKLTKRKEELEAKVQQTEEKLDKSTTENNKLEFQREQVASDLEKEKSENNRLKVIEIDLDNTKVMLNEMQSTLDKTTLELGKMEAKNRTLVKHDQALQSKHDTLLQRIDELDQECEELRDKVLDLEGERDDLDENVNKTRNKTEYLNKELTAKQQQLDIIESERHNLAQSVQTLENDVQRLHNELKETEQKMEMMVSYPSDMDAGHMGHNDLSNPLAICTEMENQISSNNIRIAMLEAQNKKLRHSIEKLATVQQQPAKLKQMDEPVLLWTSSNERPKSGQNARHSRATRSASDSMTFRENDTDVFRQTSDGHRPRPPSGTKLEQRNSPQSGRDKLFEKRQARALSAKLASSAKVAHNMVRQEPRNVHDVRVHTARDDASTTTYDPTPTFVCGACDKMYTTGNDLDIHKAFCYDLQT